MKKLLKLTIAITLALAALGTAGARANTAFMTTSGVTSPPVGHYEFCQRQPAECHQISHSDAPVVLTPGKWQTMLDVNYQVNSTIRPETDMQAYGVKEYWTFPTTVGDCEDYVLLKRRLLMDDGFPASDVLITVVLQPDGAGHAVLTVHTDRGDFVLDNMRDKVLMWSDSGYTFIKRQSAFNSGQWDKIRDARPALVGSVR